MVDWLLYPFILVSRSLSFLLFLLQRDICGALLYNRTAQEAFESCAGYMI